jgi:hypothetical protein
VLQNGKLVEPTDSKATAQAILDIILDKNKWQRYSSHGIKNILAYSWPSHCIRYLKLLDEYSRIDDPGPGLTRITTMHRKRNSDTQLEGASAFAAEPEVPGTADDQGETFEAPSVSFGRGRVRCLPTVRLPPPPCVRLCHTSVELSACTGGIPVGFIWTSLNEKAQCKTTLVRNRSHLFSGCAAGKGQLCSYTSMQTFVFYCTRHECLLGLL